MTAQLYSVMHGWCTGVECPHDLPLNRGAIDAPKAPGSLVGFPALNQLCARDSNTRAISYKREQPG